MENSPANQLPEVDSLPDGFVESSAEPLAPRTPNLEQEVPHRDYKDTITPEHEESPRDYKDTISELNRCSDAVHDDHPSNSESLPVNEDRFTESRVDKTEKLRTFPVTLSEKDSTDGYGDCSENKNCVENRECESIGTGEPGNANEHEHVQGACQSSKTATAGCSEVKITDIRETPAESAELLKNKKLETSDVKRKSVKRGFKTEKEFLEFTLKYQQVIAERDGAIAIRDKLESLCRELQRQNKMLMDECKRVSTEGQTMRLELSNKFHDAIKDVSSKLEEQKDDCISQLKENEMLRNKLKHLADQYAVSEQQFTHKLKQKTLELQIADLKIQQHEEKLTQEQSQMKLYAEQVSQLLATEKNLRLQLAADGEKFQQFQDALLKSNEVFETFKLEIEKMAKSIKELKKENIFLKSKCEKTDVTLIELVGERENMKKQLEKMKNQKEKLESLCRSLQVQRKQSLVGSSSCDTLPTVASTEEET